MTAEETSASEQTSAKALTTMEACSLTKRSTVASKAAVGARARFSRPVSAEATAALQNMANMAMKKAKKVAVLIMTVMMKGRVREVMG